MAAQVKNQNGGRKTRAEEQEIKDALSGAKPLCEVLKKLADAAERREPWAVSLYLAYMWGKPKEKQEISGPGGTPIQQQHEVVCGDPGTVFDILAAAGAFGSVPDDSEVDAVHAQDDNRQTDSIPSDPAS